MADEFQAQPFEHGYTVDDNVLPEPDEIAEVWLPRIAREFMRSAAENIDAAILSGHVGPRGHALTHRIPFEDVQKMRAAVGRK